MQRIATIYAKSLLQLATAQEILLRVHADMQGIVQTCADSPDLLTVLKCPTFQHDQKDALLQALFQDKVHPLTSKFLSLVVHKQRAVLLPTIARVFLAQYNRQQGIQTAHVATSAPLSDTVIQQLQNLVQQIAPCQEVALTQHIDPTLVGGYVLQVEDKRLDQSLRRKLKTLRKQCVTEGY